MPFAWFSMATTRSRRSWNALTNFGMKSCGPVSASVAAHCAIVQAPDVCWPWIITMASMSGFGPGAVADAPAGHRVGLRYAVHGERALVKPRLDLGDRSRTARRCRAGARTCRRSGSRPADASGARRSAPSARRPNRPAPDGFEGALKMSHLVRVVIALSSASGVSLKPVSIGQSTKRASPPFSATISG